MMEYTSKFVVVKDIPLNPTGNKTIPVGTTITRTHDVYYIDGYLMDKDFQHDFEKLIRSEEKNGWRYVRPDNPITGKSLI